MTMQVAMLLDKDYCDFTTGVTLHRALRRMAGLVFLLVFWVLEGACQRHGVGGFIAPRAQEASEAKRAQRTGGGRLSEKWARASYRWSLLRTVWLLHIEGGALALVSSAPASSRVRAVVLLFDSRRCRLCRAWICLFSFSCLQAPSFSIARRPVYITRILVWKCRLPWRAVVSGRQII